MKVILFDIPAATLMTSVVNEMDCGGYSQEHHKGVERKSLMVVLHAGAAGGVQLPHLLCIHSPLAQAPCQIDAFLALEEA